MNFCRVKLGRGVASLFKAEKIISSIRINRSLQRLPSISCFNKFQQIHHFSTDSKSPTAKRQTKQVCLLSENDYILLKYSLKF